MVSFFHAALSFRYLQHISSECQEHAVSSFAEYLSNHKGI